ncbi:F-actin capping protein beta subunit isoforms 1 and 2, putative [Coccidioides posadasii C735 delta SOWgp]|uniref:F-actin-capping protein subunit beta n=1 Tax=Coccidioides posadasii (strain C735) TaxID=222929 RepID=C5P126_COCP7|nr:F-actin capping protein beta subunit isoforms 1 and 2, putative [Coccidioides posadasii C735 delta SOWgp]EER29384.1 F-actin capping protein beta subunit isoforms 1 and 2, putative [Coccidioides posadasii C735 delta SOWgp]|eukprot:XP_003071529.1 F-actin capping protein beta subunit isoforms 1 and 2, putative [Coccidioides posadasii C735 delta SOWgp]
MADTQFDSALDLLRRLSPRDTKRNLQYITTLVPDLTEDLLASVDQPLEIRRCRRSQRDYLLCDYNRDGDSYRSPWSNEFDPPLEDGTVPSERVRKMEVAANEAFDVYRELYFEGGVGSVYFWDLDDDGFAGVVLLKKGITPGSKNSGAWDSIHVFEATDRGRICHYKLTSTVILHLSTGSEVLGDMDLSGNMTRQIEADMPIEGDASHVANVGRLVEDMELKMRNLLRTFTVKLECFEGMIPEEARLLVLRRTDAHIFTEEVYFGKAKDVVSELRSACFLYSTLLILDSYTDMCLIRRHTAIVRNKQGPVRSQRYDQFNDEIVIPLRTSFMRGGRLPSTWSGDIRIMIYDDSLRYLAHSCESKELLDNTHFDS